MNENKRILWIDGTYGISGDMFVAALLDLGADRKKLDSVLTSLRLEGFSCSVSQKNSYGISGCDFDVELESEHSHHEHHTHEHRNLADVYAVIDRGSMTDRARTLAKRIFRMVADAEAEAHGKAVEEVHFHEVGAIDSIVDIVAASVLFDDLAPDGCALSELSEGRGTVHCAHGDLPVPVPAVMNLARVHGIALRITETRGEMVTPTGIAIAAALRTDTALPPGFTIERTGIGLGKRDFARPNFLRVSLIVPENAPAADDEKLVMLEANIDDATGEELALALETLMAAGARDVHYLPCVMKKNRPAWLLRVLVDEVLLPKMERLVFSTTSTIGLRRIPVQRTRMDRRSIDVPLADGPTVSVKVCSYDGLVRCYPEFESVKAASAALGRPFRSVYSEAAANAEKQLSK